MKYKKLELLRAGDNPLIRVTFEYRYFLFWTKTITRDVVRCLTPGFEKYFQFCDNGDLCRDEQPLYAFYLSEEKEYIIND